MYSNDFKIPCIRLYHKLGSFRKVAECIGGSASSVCRWCKMVIPSAHARKQRYSIIDKPTIIDAVNIFMAANPFTTASQLKDVIKRITTISLSDEMTRLAIHKAGFTRKRPRYYAQPKHLEAATVAFLKAKQKFRKRLIIPIDETGFSSNVKPTCGYAKRGTRLHIRYLPSAIEKKHTSVVAMADPRTGQVAYQSTIGHYTEEKFLTFLATLNLPKRTVLLMDNVRFHHGRKVRAYVADRGWDILYTPPYSPWFNPIERIFSLVKMSFRRCRSITEAFSSLSNDMVQTILMSRCIE